MHFAHPVWLPIGALIAGLLVWQYRRFDRRQIALLARFSMPRLTQDVRRAVPRGRLWFKRTAFILAVMSLCAALAQPLGAMHLQESHRRGLDVLVAIDTSRSMLTPDVKPNRLARAKMAVEDLVDNLHGDAIGLIAFAGEPFLQTPVTTDDGAFRDSLNAIDTQTIPMGGTDIGAAIRLAQKTIGAHTGSDKILILITDGEDLGGDAIAAAQAAAKQGIRIYTVGVGTVAGELIPVADGSGAAGFVKDSDGQFVKSHLDETALREIARVTRGSYWTLGGSGQSLAGLYAQALNGFARHDLAERQIAVYTQLVEWPLGFGFALLVLEWLVRLGRVRAAEATRMSRRLTFLSRWTRAPALRQAAVVAVLALALPALSRASAGTAQRAYQEGHYAQSLKEYGNSASRHPRDAQLQFNMGAAAYKAGDYPRAAQAFNDSLKSPQVTLQESSYYNLGNVDYRTGEKTRAADPQQTIKDWQTAVQSYDTALELRPSDADAKFNRDFVKRKLDELQQQQKQQQQKQQQQKQQQNPSHDQQSKSQPQAGQQGAKSQPQPNGQGGKAQPQQGQQNQQNQQDQHGQQSQQAQQGQPGQQGPQRQQGKQPRPGQPQQQGPQRQQSQQAQNSGGTAAGNPTPSGQPQTRPTQTGQAQPGQMTRDEAQQLLNSLKGEEHLLAIGNPSGAPDETPQPPLKDW